MSPSAALCRGARSAWIALVMGLAGVAWTQAYGEDMTVVAGQGPLDGMYFVGDFGVAGESPDRRDTLHFDNGQFWSGNCVPCGYPPGAYWVRVTKSGIHFRGELRNPEGGRFLYVGVVRDGRLRATINWRRDRWYWSIDRDFWFKGAPASARADHATPASARQAALRGPDPALDCKP